MKQGTESPFGRQPFSPKIILRGVLWALRSLINYRDLERILAGRGFNTDHASLPC